MDKYNRLISNTLLFAISTFSSKLLSFFLTSYHTRIIVTEAYGTMSAVINVGNFLIPLVSLGISNAIIRFGLEKGVSKTHVYTNGLLSLGAGFLLLLALSPLLQMVPFLQEVLPYWPLLLVFVLVSCTRTLNCQFVRANEQVRLYALDGILCTATNLAFNVFFLSGLGYTPQGMILAMIFSDGCSVLFLFCVTKMWRAVDFKTINVPLLKKMLRYSLPLISASIFWWVTNVSDQLFVLEMLGASWNGLYAASYKLPTLLTIVATLFTEAWQISAFTDGTRAGREKFFSTVFGAYQSVMFMAAAGIVWLCRPLMSVFVGEAYYPGWIFIPMLTAATVFASLNNFLNSIYMVEKRSTLSLITMGVGAAVNLTLNFILIPLWGVNGAALATFVSYFVVFIYRCINTRNMIRIDFKPVQLCTNLGILGVQSFLTVTQVHFWALWSTLLTALMIVLNFSSLWRTAEHLLSARRKKG